MPDFTTPELASISPSTATTTFLEPSSGAATAPTITTRTAPAAWSTLSGSQPTPSISRPAAVEYCEQVQVVWSGGNGPYSLVAYAPVTQTQMIAQTNETSWSFYNRVAPGNILAISVLDNRGFNTTKMYVVDGANNGTCSDNLTVTAVPSIVTTGSTDDKSGLPGATIVGIIFAVLAFLMVVGTALWVYRRKAAPSPQRVEPYVPNHRDGKVGDRSSVISGRSASGSVRSARSALSLWSTFSNRQNLNYERNNSVEDGVRIHIDTIQVVEEPYTPMSTSPSGVAMFTPRRTTREWTGYGVAGNVRKDRVNGLSDTFNPSTVISASTIQEEETTEVEYPTHQIAKPDLSPFDDPYSVHAIGDVKSSPVASNTQPSEHDASQLSQRDLEALADIVAARLNQRGSPSSPQPRVASNASEQLPRYY